MRKPAALFPIVLALGTISVASEAAAREEGPTEIEKCQTISQPGSYKLVNNLTATGSCLVITASFVTIDLAGFTISGTVAGMATGIGAPPSSGLHGIGIRNGSISGFAFGVDLDGADGSVVEGLRVFGGFGTNTGIIASGIVKGNAVISIDGTGISATGTVTGNYAAANRRLGIEVGQGSTVIGNTATGNDTGLAVSCPSNLTDNTAVNNLLQNLVLNGTDCHNEDNVAP